MSIKDIERYEIIDYHALDGEIAEEYNIGSWVYYVDHIAIVKDLEQEYQKKINELTIKLEETKQQLVNLLGNSMAYDQDEDEAYQNYQQGQHQRRTQHEGKRHIKRFGYKTIR